MDTAKSIFLAISIILFVIGMWPIAILTGTICITLMVVANIQRKKELQELKEENQELKAEMQKLRQEQEQAQTVRRAIEKSERKKAEEKER